MPIKITATTFLNKNSKFLILLYAVPTPEIVKAINHAKITTGIPVAMANITGKCSPEVEIVNGISIPKYKTPL